MSVDLSVTEDEMEEAQSLLEGYIGPVELVNLEDTTLGEDETPVLRFTFECQDEDHIGQQFEHIEWPINEQDLNETDANDQSNAKIQLRRMIHMLSRLLAVDPDTVREKIVRLNGDTLSEAWDNLRMRVMQAYNKYGTTNETVHAKAFARERNGYVNVQFGKYPGFIRVVGDDPKLEFTSWERERNQEAREFMAQSPDGDDEFVDEDDEFDFDDAEF